MNDHQNATEQAAANRNLSKLEGDCTGMSHDLCANLDELGLKAGQRPIRYLFEQFSAL